MKDSLFIEEAITDYLREINNLKTKLDNKEQEKQDLFKELALSIIDTIDTFERIEEGLIEKGLDKTEDGGRAIKRYATVNKKLNSILNRYGITPLEFPENRLIIGFSKVVETEPNKNKRNDDIVSVQKKGYIRGKELIREAEVVVVKN